MPYMIWMASDGRLRGAALDGQRYFTTFPSKRQPFFGVKFAKVRVIGHDHMWFRELYCGRDRGGWRNKPKGRRGTLAAEIGVGMGANRRGEEGH